MATKQQIKTTTLTRTPDEAQTAAACNFLDLPPELRLQIYADYLQDQHFKHIARPALLQSSDFFLKEASELYCKRIATVISESNQVRRTTRKQRNQLFWLDGPWWTLQDEADAAKMRMIDLIDFAKSEVKILGYSLRWKLSGEEAAVLKLEAPVDTVRV